MITNCQAVLSSDYALILHTAIPTSAAGMVFFVLALAASILQKIYLNSFRLSSLSLILAGIGLITALYLVFIEIDLIGAICLYCTATHIMVLIFFLTNITRWTERRKEE